MVRAWLRAAVATAVLLAACTPVPAPSGTPSIEAPSAVVTDAPVGAGSPSAGPPVPAEPSPVGEAIPLPNLGVSLGLPAGWRIRTGQVDELTAADVSNPLDSSALVALAGNPVETSSLGRTGLLAIRDEPPAWIDVVASVSGRYRETLRDEVTIQTQAGTAVTGTLDAPDQRPPTAVAYVDIPAGDWDLALTGRVGPGAEETAMELLAAVLSTVRLSGAPATTGQEFAPPRSDDPAPDPVLDAWFPESIVGAPATASTQTGRSVWLTSLMTPAKGTIFELCARLAPTADDVSILIGTVRPAGAEPVSVLGCRVDGADPEDWKAVIPMSPLEGWDRPVYATASGGVIGRWVVAGEVATIVLGTDESRVEAVAEDLPADLVAAP